MSLNNVSTVGGQDHSPNDPLHVLDFVKDKVPRALDSPPRKAGDWSITETVSCGCTDCKALTAFLQDRERRDRLKEAKDDLAEGR